MQKPEGYDELQVGWTPIELGGHKLIIKGAEEGKSQSGKDMLVLSFDITEGEHAGFFKADYNANTNEDKKWRGTFRISIPKDDGSEKDGWTKRTFNNMIACVEESNPGYHWDWNEANHSPAIDFYKEVIQSDKVVPATPLPYYYLIDNLLADHRNLLTCEHINTLCQATINLSVA